MGSLVSEYIDKRSPYGGEARPHHSCPQCEGRVIRIRRRPIDRLMSLMHRVHRYRCRSSTCAWEGNLEPIDQSHLTLTN